MYRLVSLFLLAMILSACCGYKSPFRQHSFQSLYLKPNEKITDKFDYDAVIDIVFGWGAQVRSQTGIRLTNSCVVYDGKIKTIRMEFVTQKIHELQDARRTIVYIVEGLLNRVNNYFGIAGDLSNRPFGPENLQIIVTYESFEGVFIDPEFNGRITLINGEVIFSTAAIYDSQLDRFGCKHEPYHLVKELVLVEERMALPYSQGGYNPPAEYCPERHFRELYVPPSCLYVPPPY